MNAGDMRVKSCCLGEWNSFRKLPRRCFNLVTLIDESIGECSEERDVRGIGKIDPEAHCYSDAIKVRFRLIRHVCATTSRLLRSNSPCAGPLDHPSQAACCARYSR